jgi:two-component system, NtrC family, response regulator HydG
MTADPMPSVLVVDDDQDTCRNLADILSDLGYRVDTAPNGLIALDLIRKAPYDVALLDYKMPGMTGLELYREIKKARSGTVAVIVSAYIDAATRDEALGAGAWQVLSKPVDLPRLLGLVDEALGQPLVLVVDDDSELCQNLWDLLRERGFRVCLANDAQGAAERARERNHKVVLIDMRLPDGSGSDVFRAVREANPGAHTVVITGHSPDIGGQVEQILREGADAVCYKPFDVPSLLATLDRLTKSKPVGQSEV